MTVNTIVFGPTGGVGSFAALYAASQGSHVTLAMRDPTKVIPGLSSAQEQSSNYTRVKADLSDPHSVGTATAQAKAHSAFIYEIFPVPKESIQALKDAGVKHVVFLSTNGIRGDLSAIPKSEFIAWGHAQTELKLEEVFGDGNFSAIRPTFFASNINRYKKQIFNGVVREIRPDNLVDFVTPKDMGEVSGALLVTESSIPRAVEVTGPQAISLEHGLRLVGRAAGRDFKIEEVDETEGARINIEEHHIPPPIAKYLASVYANMHAYTGVFEGPEWEAGHDAVRKYVGREPQSFESWVEENKAAFV